MTPVAAPLSTLVPRKQVFFEFQHGPGAAVFLGVELLNGQRFPRQARLDDEQVLARYEAEIGWDHVPGRELDHVARHQVAQRQLAGLSGADHRRRDADHGLELGGGVAGPQFLNESQGHPQDDHTQHDDRRGRPIIVGHQRNGRQQQEQDHQGIGTGSGQEFDPPIALFVRDHVGAVLLQAASGLLLAQAGVAGFQPAKHLLGITPGDLREQGRNLDRLRRPAQGGQDVFRQAEDRQDRHGLPLAGIGGGGMGSRPTAGRDRCQAIIKGQNWLANRVERFSCRRNSFRCVAVLRQTE